MAKPKPGFKRRQFFIKKGFQSRFILIFCVVIFVGAVLSAGFTLYFSKGNVTSSFIGSRLQVKDTAIYILPAVLYTTVITTIIVTFCIMVLTLFVSHKIAGPLFKIEKDINIVAEGDLTHVIWLRLGDQLRQMSMDINQMTKNLNRRMTTIHEGVEKVIGRASELGAPQEFQDQLSELQNRIDRNFKLREAEEADS